MLHPSFALILSWPTPNYDDPVTRGSGRVVVCVIFTFLMCLVVALRFYTRLVLTKSFGRDDVLIAIATIFSIVFNFLLIISDTVILSIRHIWDIPLTTAPTLLKVMVAAEVLYGLSSSLVKCSLLAMLRRLLANSSQKWLIRITYVCDILTIISGFSWVFVAVFQCRPVKAVWEISPSYPYTCISSSLELGFASWLTITDFMVLAMPISVIWKLQLPQRQRRTVMLLLSLSLFACIAGVIRNVYLGYSLPSYDLLWTSWQYSIAAVVEVDLGVICASIPALWPLVARHFPKLSHPAQRSKPTPKPNSNPQPKFIRIRTPLDDPQFAVISSSIKQSNLDWSITSVVEGQESLIDASHDIQRGQRNETYL